jgi:hypothetical protein
LVDGSGETPQGDTLGCASWDFLGLSTDFDVDVFLPADFESQSTGFVVVEDDFNLSFVGIPPTEFASFPDEPVQIAVASTDFESFCWKPENGMDAGIPFELVDGFFLTLLSIGDLESQSVFSCKGAGGVTDFASSLSLDFRPEKRAEPKGAFESEEVDFVPPVLLSVDFDLDLEGLPPTELESQSVFVVEEDFSFICLGSAVTDFASM